MERGEKIEVIEKKYIIWVLRLNNGYIMGEKGKSDGTESDYQNKLHM